MEISETELRKQNQQLVEKINKIDNPLISCTRKKERLELLIISERRDITTSL